MYEFPEGLHYVAELYMLSATRQTLEVSRKATEASDDMSNLSRKKLLQPLQINSMKVQLVT